MKKILILIIMLSLITSCKKALAEKVGAFIDKNNTDVLIFSKFTDFEWDYLWITTTRDIETVKSTMQEKNIDFSYLEKSDILKKTESWTQIMIFTTKNKVTYCDIPPETGYGIDVIDKYNFVFPKNTKKYIIFSKENAKFKIIKQGTSIIYYDLVPINSTSD